MNELCIPTEVWMCVAKYYENPVSLLRLAGACRNSYKGATMDIAWEALIPYECEGNFYRAFIDAALATTENNRCIIRCCWTGSFPPKECFPDCAFQRKDFDTAFALAAQKEHLDKLEYTHLLKGWGRHRRMCPKTYSYLFDICVQDRTFMVTALKFSPWLYDKYTNPSDWYSSQYVSSNAEYCEMAMQYSAHAWVSARRRDFQAWKSYDLRKKMLALYPRAFLDIFWLGQPCSDPEFILGSAPFCPPEILVPACHPDVFGLGLCEQLCRIGFPIWLAKPDIDPSFLKRFHSFTRLPPMLNNDREMVASVAKNDCFSLRSAVPELRRDIPLVLSIFEHNPHILHHCDASIFTDAEFLRSFKEALRKPNHFFFLTRSKGCQSSTAPFPNVLQTRELALIAVESQGQWIHYFSRFWKDFGVMKAAVVTWPLAYRYAPLKIYPSREWCDSICRINPSAVWLAGERFIRENRSIVNKALQLGPLQNDYDNFPFVQKRRYLIAKDIECVLPDILRAHPWNFEILCSSEMNRRFIFRKKRMIIAALEGTRDVSILWNVSPEILDEEIWNKVREVR